MTTKKFKPEYKHLLKKAVIVSVNNRMPSGKPATFKGVLMRENADMINLAYDFNSLSNNETYMTICKRTGINDDDKYILSVVHDTTVKKAIVV